MDQKFLSYFKEVVEGNASVCWIHWFKENEVELKESMKRPAFLRLKFNKIDEAIKYLDKHGVSFNPAPNLNQIIHRTNYVIEALERDGSLKIKFWRKAYNNAFGLYEDGKIEECTKKLSRYLKSASKKSPDELVTDFSDYSCDSTSELNHGRKKLGLLMLEQLSDFKSNDDFVLHYVDDAKSIISENTKEKG